MSYTHRLMTRRLCSTNPFECVSVVLLTVEFGECSVFLTSGNGSNAR